MGYSDHLAQILGVSTDKGNKEGKKVLQRNYTTDNVTKFTTMLTSKIYVEKCINEICKQFINKCLDKKVFPLKLPIKRYAKSKTWISKGIKVYYQKMRGLNELKQRIALPTKTLTYINRYQRIYKRVILEAKKRHDKCIENTSNLNKTI
jgi:hypothetical protein